jgi:hypothetical protein
MRKLIWINQLSDLLREHFFKDPTLALAYFNCCSTDPCVAVFNNELQPDVDKQVIWNRISNLIGSPIGQEEAILCQETFCKLDQSHARISACASCCEHFLSADGHGLESSPHDGSGGRIDHSNCSHDDNNIHSRKGLAVCLTYPE